MCYYFFFDGVCVCEELPLCFSSMICSKVLPSKKRKDEWKLIKIQMQPFLSF